MEKSKPKSRKKSVSSSSSSSSSVSPAKEARKSKHKTIEKERSRDNSKEKDKQDDKWLKSSLIWQNAEFNGNSKKKEKFLKLLGGHKIDNKIGNNNTKSQDAVTSKKLAKEIKNTYTNLETQLHNQFYKGLVRKEKSLTSNGLGFDKIKK